MHKLPFCGSEHSKKLHPACEKKQKNALLAFFSYLFFLPHLSSAKEREHKRELIWHFTAVLFILYALCLLFGLLMPAVNVVIGEEKNNSYTLLSLLSGAYPQAVTTIACTILALVFITLAFAVFCYICKQKIFFTRNRAYFDVARFFLYAAMLAVSIYFSLKIAQLFSPFVTEEGAEVKTGTAPILFLTLTGCAAGVSLIAEFCSLRLHILNEYKPNSIYRAKLEKNAAYIDLFSPKAVGALHKLLDLLPALIVCLFCAVAVILCFTPKDSFLVSYTRSAEFVRTMNALIEEEARAIEAQEITTAVYKNFVVQVEQMELVRDTMLADMVLGSLLFALSAYTVAVKFKRGKTAPRMISALPFFIYAASLFLGLVTLLPIIKDGVYPLPATFKFDGFNYDGKDVPYTLNEADAIPHIRAQYLLAICIPIGILILLSILLPIIRNALGNTFDISMLAEHAHAFEKNRGIHRFNLMRGTQGIGDYAFSSCERMTSVITPSSCRSVGMGAFETCTMLSRAIFQNGLEEIGDYAFVDCETLSEVILPASCKRIGDYAFANCILLKCICFGGSSLEWQAVEKGEHWDDGMGSYRIRCKDKDLIVRRTPQS